MEVNPLLKTTEVENPSPVFRNSDRITSGSIFETLKSGLISAMEENPVVKNVEIENPSTDFDKSEGVSDASVTKTQECVGIPGIDCCEIDVISGGYEEECNEDNREVIEDVCGYDDDDIDCGTAECSQFYGTKLKKRRNNFEDRETGWSSYRPSGWSEPELCPVGAGLSNLGNTCFLNVIMQCFTHTVPFVQGLQSLKHVASSHGKDDFCVLCVVRDQIEQSLAFSGKIVSPYNLVDNLSHISSSFHRYQQEDAHEFLQCLFDKLDSNWSKHESGAGKQSSHDSLVKQVFGGQLVSQLRCCKCGYNSDIYEPMNDLSLEIEDVDDLESAFKSFTKLENLEDTATCDGCKEKVQREKQLLLDHTPPVAALHLKRFKSDGIHVEKIKKMVKYPLDLDLNPFAKGARDDNEDLKYELYGFVVHVGSSSTSGHYFCFIRTSPDSWYRFDDSKVMKVSEETALDQKAYILFYARKGTPWFSGLLDNWKACLEEKLNTSPISVLDSHSFDKRDSTSVIYAEPLNCLRFDEVANEAEGNLQVPAGANNCGTEPSTPLSNGEKVVRENFKDETKKTSLVTPSVSNVEKHLACQPKNDIKIDLFTSETYSDEEPAAEVPYKIPVNHLKIQQKASLSLSSSSPSSSAVSNTKQDLERKEAAKYIKSSSMPTSRRQMLMAAITTSQNDHQSKNRRHSSSNHQHSSKKRKMAAPEHSPRKRHKISCR